MPPARVEYDDTIATVRRRHIRRGRRACAAHADAGRQGCCMRHYYRPLPVISGEYDGDAAMVAMRRATRRTGLDRPLTDERRARLASMSISRATSTARAIIHARQAFHFTQRAAVFSYGARGHTPKDIISHARCRVSISRLIYYSFRR